MDVKIFPSTRQFDQAFQAYLSDEITPRLPDQDQLYDLETELIDRIEKMLAPQIGAWAKTNNWWHQMDFHGDGIRELVFTRAYFHPKFVRSLQSMLVDEYQVFAFYIQVPDSMNDLGEETYGRVAIFNEFLLANRSFVDEFARDVNNWRS